MVVVAIAVVVMLVGALLYFVGRDKWVEFGRVMFSCGLLAALLTVASHPALILTK